MNTLNRQSLISDTLKQLGISPSLQGYRCLRDCIELVMSDNTLIFRGSVTKILYPTMSKKYQLTCGAVERCMRHAISKAFDRCSEFAEKMFGYIARPEFGTVTNSEFIATVADYLTLKEKSDEQR